MYIRIPIQLYINSNSTIYKGLFCTRYYMKSSSYVISTNFLCTSGFRFNSTISYAYIYYAHVHYAHIYYAYIYHAYIYYAYNYIHGVLYIIYIRCLIHMYKGLIHISKHTSTHAHTTHTHTHMHAHMYKYTHTT